MSDLPNVSAPTHWTLRTRTVPLARTVVMGILNVTPDSFSDGGLASDATRAIAHGMTMAEAGTDIVDVGGESTRPGAAAVDALEELGRVLPVVRALSTAGVPVSIDTMKPEVARQAVDAGAQVINDVSGFRDPAMVDVAAESGAGVVIMHMQGEPRTMQIEPNYHDVVENVAAYLARQAERLTAAGVSPDRIVIDPGIGFGKTLAHNLQLLGALDRFTAIGYPVLVGPSRKRFLGMVTGIDAPADRDVATSAAAVLAIAAGASVIRVHNVPLVLEAVKVADAIVRATWRSPD